MDDRTKEQALALREEARAITVRSDEDAERALTFIGGLRDLAKRIKATFDPVVASAHKAHKDAVAARKMHLAPVEEAERIVKEAVGAHEHAKREAIREAEAKRRAEEERLEAAAREERERRAAATDPWATEAAPLPPPPPSAPPPPVEAPLVPERTKGVSTRTVWRSKVVDLHALVLAVARGEAPLECVLPDLSYLDGYARSHEGSVDVPGVEWVPEVRTSVRV